MRQHRLALMVRDFSRREKTSIRQDVKRFEKIGRDHGCRTLDDYVEFVTERTRRDEEGNFTQRSFELFRGLGAYFGQRLMDETTLSRLAADVSPGAQHEDLTQQMVEANPGWLLADFFQDQFVTVPFLLTDHIFANSWGQASLDDLFDELIDWNHGYLSKDDVEAAGLFGSDVVPDLFLAA